MTIEIREDTFYQIFSKNSGKVLDVLNWSYDNSAKIIQFESHRGDNQQWMFFKLDGGYYAIVSKHSGKVLDVRGEDRKNASLIQQFQWRGDAGNQKWIIKKVPDKDRYAYLQAKHSAKVIDVLGFNKNNGADIAQWDLVGGENQMWEFVPVENISFPEIKTGELPDCPQFKSLSDNLPDSTDPVVTSYVKIPCIYVNGDLEDQVKMKISPYYILKKTQHWQKLDSMVIAPGKTQKSRIETGITQTDQQSMNQTLNVSITTDAGFDFEPFSASISTTISAGLEMNRSSITERMTSQVIEEELTNPTDHLLAWAKYAVVNEFSLHRMDDNLSLINSWRFTDNNRTKETAFPVGAQNKLLSEVTTQ
ncbi:RICIN domain-containing protein [Domibacillus tundrae]|uniref:RICIN domain-containing protein n=1 Tax=Domibacillus tundrae TaxID=1587527 RepID=UPI0006986A82|nr:RICIN domain-containing protein [Domibacillus tundrae]